MLWSQADVPPELLNEPGILWGPSSTASPTEVATTTLKQALASSQDTRAVMEGELSTITVERPDGSVDLLVHTSDAAMTERTRQALRIAYPTNLIRVSGKAGNSVEVVQNGAEPDGAAVHA